MEEHDQQPPPRPRRRRPNGRWSNPASPLQAARFARREGAKQVIQGIRKICPGHGHGPCRLDVSKLSDFESFRRRPSIEHIESFCRYYQQSPESLGLITWRDEQPLDPETAAPTNSETAPSHIEPDEPDQEQLVLDWLHDSAVTVATAVLEILAQCPVKIAGPSEEATTGDDDPPEDDPPAGVAVPD